MYNNVFILLFMFTEEIFFRKINLKIDLYFLLAAYNIHKNIYLPANLNYSFLNAYLINM